ncbi:hypothetical protein NDU88_001739 [Pleurodeles waltl]|uniref:Uncharacterized protein n=1 Tax=Pleurodeles waltl TaxID=8319 RepID=A0AAV7VCC1_PLEWA|nr:hypothetical protein NDU88_001739 [Pleurodeles waltl]
MASGQEASQFRAAASFAKSHSAVRWYFLLCPCDVIYSIKEGSSVNTSASVMSRESMTFDFKRIWAQAAVRLRLTRLDLPDGSIADTKSYPQLMRQVSSVSKLYK